MSEVTLESLEELNSFDREHPFRSWKMSWEYFNIVRDEKIRDTIVRDPDGDEVVRVSAEEIINMFDLQYPLALQKADWFRIVQERHGDGDCDSYVTVSIDRHQLAEKLTRVAKNYESHIVRMLRSFANELLRDFENLNVANPDVEGEEFIDDWIVPDLLATGDRVVIYAPTGEGKSWLVMQQAADISRGVHPLTGDDLPDGPRSVVYIDLEMGIKKTTRRVDVLGVDTEHFHWTCMTGFDATDPKTFTSLNRMIALHQPAAIFIGPVKNMIRGAFYGNSSATADGFFAVRELVEQWSLKGMAVVLEHHTTKTGSTIAGDGQLESSVTDAVHLKKTRGGSKLVPTKERDPRAWGDFGTIVQATPKDSGDGRWTQKARVSEDDQTTSTSPKPSAVETVKQRRKRISDHLGEHPNDAKNKSQLAQDLGIDRGTLRRDLKAMELVET